MSPYFFAAMPKDANRIQGELGPENVTVFGNPDVTKWSLAAVDGIAAQNSEAPLRARRLPSLRDVREFGASAVSNGAVLMRAEVEGDYELEVLANRAKVEIALV